MGNNNNKSTKININFKVKNLLNSKKKVCKAQNTIISNKNSTNLKIKIKLIQLKFRTEITINLKILNILKHIKKRVPNKENNYRSFKIKKNRNNSDTILNEYKIF